ncbi:hypothetical protein CHLNCDRAFT_138349 [Chlorella variabilis]|uniref:HVA22-like protein n=1 Tax=Chlorella variabilis TaxID=554065 RepID=E1ZMU9_CHLVA|nr:hypothetical protein CHLNCDRAFT_138349 [Chlorella variabilis]EFN52753.1 hypothetical protein CHLNCDRAFT_138349 [Chlorella variabilis]|eukprot:XP_005844855.1 hypothetical protein CHLNCDRAFT_138349 [Chlorella variabilis]
MVLKLLLSLIPTYGNICRLAALLVGLVLPTFKSFEAIESRVLDDDKQVCYATLLSLETVAWSFLIWIPFYRMIRVALLAWLALPQFAGAAFVYEEFVRPFLLVAVAKAREVPSLEPYVARFAASAAKHPSTSSEAPSAAAAPPPAVDYDALKREAVAKVEESFEKAKQQAASPEGEEDESPTFQPLKAHAQ